MGSPDRLPPSPAFDNDRLSPEEFLEQRRGLIELGSSDDPAARADAIRRLEELELENPKMAEIHAAHMLRMAEDMFGPRP